jgi:hypothetical protein
MSLSPLLPQALLDAHTPLRSLVSAQGLCICFCYFLRLVWIFTSVGAGPAGISAASELRRLDNGKSTNYIDITIFDRGHIIGGRLTNPVVAGRSTTYGKIFPFDDPRQDPISPEEIAGAPLLSFLGSTAKTSREVGL